MTHGFSTEQTALIKAWIDGNQEAWKTAMDQAASAWAASREAPALMEGHQSRRQIASAELAGWLEEWVWQQVPLEEQHQVFHTLLTQSLEQVRWQEMAAKYIDSVAN